MVPIPTISGQIRDKYLWFPLQVTRLYPQNIHPDVPSKYSPKNIINIAYPACRLPESIHPSQQDFSSRRLLPDGGALASALLVAWQGMGVSTAPAGHPNSWDLWSSPPTFKWTMMGLTPVYLGLHFTQLGSMDIHLPNFVEIDGFWQVLTPPIWDFCWLPAWRGHRCWGDWPGRTDLSICVHVYI